VSDILQNKSLLFVRPILE